MENKFKKVILMALLAMVMVVGMAMVAYATSTFVNPADGDTVSGQIEINTTSTRLQNMTNCTITWSSTLQGHSTNVTMANVTAFDFKVNATNITFATTQVPDAIDYVLSGVCYNNSAVEETEALTSITVTVDNTNPGCYWASTLTNGSTVSRTQTFAVTSSNASTARIKFGGNAYQSMTRGANSSYNWIFTFDPTNNPLDEGIIEIITETSDGTDTTTCQLNDIDIDEGARKLDILWLNQAARMGSSGGREQSVLGQQFGNTPITNGVALLILAGVVFYFWQKKK